MRVGLRWSELPGSFRVCSVMGLIGGAYQAFWLLSPLLLLVPGLFAGPPWGEGLLAGVFYYSLAVVLLAILPIISVGGAIGLLTLPMREDHRGILAFFVMLSSIFPIVFLGFKLLGFFFPLWPLLAIAAVWVVLVSMALRILRARR